MPVSFWFFLAVCVISFIPVIKDHGDSWKEYVSSAGKEKRFAALQVLALWTVPVFTALATIITGFEAISSGRENALLIKEAGDARKEAAESNERSQSLALQVEELRKANLELYSRIQPRRITNEQRIKIISKLRDTQKGKVKVVTRLDDLESLTYFTQIVTALRDAGFRVEGETATGILPTVIGVQYWYKGPIPQHGARIMEALSSAGIAHTSTNIYGNMDADLFQVFVGYKPLPKD